MYAGQEATVRTRHGITDWFQIGKGVHQGCMLSPCLFNLYAEYIMRNAGLEEAQAGINIARRNISNLRYADDTTLMAESEDELKSLLMNVKEEQKKVALNIQKTKIWSRSWQPTPVFLPGEFHGQRSLAGYSAWRCKESDTTERLITALSLPLSSMCLYEK